MVGVAKGNVVGILFVFFFFNDTATTEIYTLSLHDALPIWFRFIDERIVMNSFELQAF